MQRTMYTGALLAGAIAIALAAPLTARAADFAHPHPHVKQKARKVANSMRKIARKPPVKHAAFAVTYTGEAAKRASSQNSGFWITGGSIDGAATLRRGLGFAANLSVVHASNITPGTNVGKTTIVFGPRYTKDTTEWVRKGGWIHKGDWFKKMPPSQVFAEALFGFAHGFDGAFPEGSTLYPSASSAAIQLGVGVDVTLWKHFGARLFELDYVRTGLPNGAANSQNDLRLSFGVNYRWDSPGEAKPQPGASPAAADADDGLPGITAMPVVTVIPLPPLPPPTPESAVPAPPEK
jgi:hypothetical protein